MSEYLVDCSRNTDPFLAAELEGDGGASVPAGAHDISGDDPGPLPEINFDDGRYFFLFVNLVFRFRLQRIQPISIDMQGRTPKEQ